MVQSPIPPEEVPIFIFEPGHPAITGASVSVQTPHELPVVTPPELIKFDVEPAVKGMLTNVP